jgi:hypothetical protein
MLACGSLLISAACDTAVADTLPAGAWLGDALSAHVTDTGWEFITAEFEEYLDEEFEPLVQSLAPVEVFDEGCFWLYTAYITSFESVDHARPELSIVPMDGYLQVDLEVADINIYLWLEGDGLFCLDHYDCWSHLTADRVATSAQFYLEVIDGQVHTRAENVSAWVDNYEYDTTFDCFIIETIAEILQSTIEESLEDLLSDSISQDLPPEIDTIFASLATSSEFSLFDVPIGFESAPTAVGTLPNGSTIDIGGRALTYYASCGPQEFGSLLTPGDAIDYPLDVPEVGGGYDAAASVSDDALNAVLHMTYDTGAICLYLDADSQQKYGLSWDLTTTDLILFFPELYDLYPGAPTRLDVLPQAAPYVEIGEGGGILEGQLQAHIPTAYVDLGVWDGTQWLRALRLDVLYEADLLVHVNSHGRLRVLMAGLPNVEIEIIEEGLVDLNDLLIEQALPLALEIVTPLLVASLDNFPLPTLYGYGIEPIAVVADGPDAQHLSLYGTLFVDPEIAGAAPAERWPRLPLR